MDQAGGNQDQIEDLLRTLHGQIKSSEWLNENTNKLENENPGLIKAWKEAVDASEPKTPAENVKTDT